MCAPSPLYIAGVDEVGRGALFGVVVAAAVILDRSSAAQLATLGVTDSKALSSKRRDRLDQEIRDRAVSVAVGVATVAEIDERNILQATFLAMGRAIAGLSVTPHLCSIDGNRPIPGLHIPQRTVVQGDRRDLAIGAASIVAKVWRDREMVRLAAEFPGYGLEQHKGYGTAAHREAIARLGITREHRRSFAPCQVKQEELLLDFQD